MLLIVGIFFGIGACLMVVGLITHPSLSRKELSSIEVYGQMVDVSGSKMHVYSMGDGPETIVLMPGYGTPLPAADFGPLMRELSKNHTVVALDFFGVGFSELSNAPRTNENYTQEIREALTKAGFTPPYVLMPHSAAGVYTEYYATKYPDEVKAIVMLDSTSTAVVDDVPRWMGLVFKIAKFQQRAGVNRINAKLVPETKRIENGYLQKEIDNYRTYIAHSINDTMIDQMLRLGENIHEVKAMEFPSHIPVLKFIATETVAAMAKQTKSDGMNYQNEHLQRLGSLASYRVLEASHLLYQTKSQEIAAITTEYLEAL